MPECIVPGCGRDGTNNLSIRCRRPDTSAIWAPNTDAFLCNAHATAGARLHLLYEATETGRVETHVHGWLADPGRTTDIRHPARLDEELRAAAQTAAAREKSPEID
jgi:hypothetical protein